MHMKRFVDRLQVFFYLAGFPRVASFVGGFGTIPQLVSASELDRITLPEIDTMIPIDVVEDEEVRAGQGWCLDDVVTGPPRVLVFDPTFNDNDGIDIEHDIVWPTMPRDVN